ncbi:metallophosphoesterase [Marinilabilia rubra]|uniref:Metallophosphoesterase n=1 Tax=Marinilabilia rubra TaxID=2162893 RepID=A0A2U2B3Y7_9BACT|nr:metallophosphoesterase [Marinilabilia rubra]PWD97782.1 metallophosphoesterase [Marinilabilia rubra]
MRYHLAFLFVLVLLVGAIDWFLWQFWSKNTLPPKIKKVLGVIGFLILPVGFLSGFFVFGFLIPDANSHEVYNAFSVFLTLFLFIYLPKVFFLFVYGVGQLPLLLQRKTIKKRKRHYPGISRAKFLSQIGIIMATAPFVALLFGVFKGRFAFYTRHLKLSFPNFPTAFDGLKIVQISDLHLGSFGTNRAPLKEAVSLINEENPDIVLFTGDLVNNFAGETRDWEAIFGKIKASMGKYSILGNHDYGDYSTWSSKERKAANFKSIVSANRRLGFQLLRNESVTIEKDGAKIALSGVENWGHPPFPQYGDIDKAWQQTNGETFKILMSHDPDHWDAQVVGKKPYDLTLAGHTHGMQFGVEVGNFNWSPAKYKFKRWAGLYQVGKQFLYVNRGLGYLGMPARVGMPPEITVFTLSAAKTN